MTPRQAPRTTHKYGEKFKAIADKLNDLPSVATKDTGGSLYLIFIHLYCLVGVSKYMMAES